MKIWKIIVIILILLFFWFQVRPSLIRSFCSDQSNTKAQELAKVKFYNTVIYGTIESHKLLLKEDYNWFYQKCLGEKGLK